MHKHDATYPRMFLRMLNHGLNHLYCALKPESSESLELKSDDCIHVRECLSADLLKELFVSCRKVCWPVE